MDGALIRAVLAIALLAAMAAPAAADRYVAGAPGADDPFFPQAGNRDLDAFVEDWLYRDGRPEACRT